jgi:predicted Zn finger-like uncharacterized protein
MKFLCPNCKAKYRIGPEKMAGRQAAKIRCRKCEFLIQIAYRTDSDEFDVTATPPTIPPATSASRAAKGPLPPVPSPGRSRLAALDVPEGIANKKPTAAVPGLPGLGSAKSTRGAALLSDPSALGRRPLAPLPPPPMASTNTASAGIASLMALPGAGSHTGIVAAVALPSPSAPPGAVPVTLPLPAPAPAPRPSSNSTQLGDQFRESVQASGTEDLPQEGWFVGVNGVPLGPIPLGDLRELAVAGHIDRRSLVWREGQAEWRPLGKFPGLSRVIDDGTSPPSPLPEAPSVPAAAPAASNGSNGHAEVEHLATGFDVPRADAGERPSVWGDLDDEDDDDEQPTTVKGRVSIMPSSTSLPAPVPPAPAVSAPPVSAPPLSATLLSSAPPAAPTLLSSAPPAAPMSSRPFGATGTVSAIPGLTPPPPAVGIPGMGSGPMIGLAVESSIDTDAALMRPSGRNRWYVIVAAIIFAFALGAIVMHLVWSSGPEKPGQSAVPTAPASGSRLARATSEDELPPGPGETSPRRAAEPSHQPAPDTILGATAALRPTSTPVPPRATRSANGSLLSGLMSSAIAGPSSGNAPEGRATGSGLDATAIQRTVRRYSPAVRQNCWQRALDARAPGVPTSAKVVASITVDPSGRVQAVSVSGAPRGYPGLSRCIESSVRGWQFPRAASQTVTSATFNFIG